MKFGDPGLVHRSTCKDFTWDRFSCWCHNRQCIFCAGFRIWKVSTAPWTRLTWACAATSQRSSAIFNRTTGLSCTRSRSNPNPAGLSTTSIYPTLATSRMRPKAINLSPFALQCIETFEWRFVDTGDLIRLWWAPRLSFFSWFLLSSILWFVPGSSLWPSPACGEFLSVSIRFIRM